MMVLAGILTVLLPPILIFFIRKKFDDFFNMYIEPGPIVIFSIMPGTSIIVLLLLIISLDEQMLKKITLDMLHTLIYFLPVVALGLLWIM